VCGCSRDPKSSPTSAAPAKDIDVTDRLASGSSGAAGETYGIQSPYWQKNQQVLLLGMTTYPGKPPGPGFLVVIRLPANKTEVWGGLGGVELNPATSPGVRMQLQQGITGGPHLKYQLLREKNREVLWLGAQEHALEKGALFLIDTRGEKPVVTQIEADLSKAFGKIENEPSKEQFAGALEQLKEAHGPVRDLLAKQEQP
jgi:hypothetical protein